MKLKLARIGRKMFDKMWSVSLLCLISVCAIRLAEAKRKSYRGYEVLKVETGSNCSSAQLDLLLEHENVDVWKHPSDAQPHFDVMVDNSFKTFFKKSLDQLGINYSVWIADVQNLIDKSSRKSLKGRRGRRNSRLMRLDRYNSYAKIWRWMVSFAKNNRDIVSLVQVGTTSQGRRIHALKVGVRSNSTKPVFWQDSLIHAREWVTGATLLWVANHMVRHYRRGDPEVTSFLREMDWMFLPVWNVDGYIYTWTTERMWRKSRSEGLGKCRGVDLNRNFDTPNLADGTTSNFVCSGVYRGSGAFSESESSTVSAYLRSIPVAAFISLHSYAQFWLYPYGFKSAPSLDHADLERVARKAVKAIHLVNDIKYKQGTVEELAYLVSGGSIDWAHRSLCVKFAFGVELRDRGKFGFVLPDKFILPTAREYYQGMKVVANEVMNSQDRVSSYCQVSSTDHSLAPDV